MIQSREEKDAILAMFGTRGSEKEKRHMEIAAVQFLLWQKQCVLFTKERGGHLGNPDVLGVTKSRHMIEIEIKSSVSDFRRNKKKAGQIALASAPELGPHYFYYMVSPDIAAKVLPEVEGKYGLMTLCPTNYSKILKPAYRIHDRKATLRKIAELVRAESGTMLNMMHKLKDKYAEVEALKAELSKIQINEIVARSSQATPPTEKP